MRGGWVFLSLAPIFAAVLILPPALAALAIAAAFVPESLRSRPRWYIVLFNVANFVGPALPARACFDAFHGSTDRGWALAALVAIGLFITVHYGVLATMLRLARGVRVPTRSGSTASSSMLVERNALEPRITVSVGVAAHRGGEATPDELIALADRAAYRAKFSSRNSVAVQPEGGPVHEAERVLLDALGDSA